MASHVITALLNHDFLIMHHRGAMGRQGLKTALDSCITYLQTSQQTRSTASENFQSVRFLQSVLHMSIACPNTIFGLEMWNQDTLQDELDSALENPAINNVVFMDYVSISASDFGKRVLQDALALQKKVL